MLLKRDLEQMFCEMLGTAHRTDRMNLRPTGGADPVLVPWEMESKPSGG